MFFLQALVVSYRHMLNSKLCCTLRGTFCSSLERSFYAVLSSPILCSAYSSHLGFRRRLASFSQLCEVTGLRLGPSTLCYGGPRSLSSQRAGAIMAPIQLTSCFSGINPFPSLTDVQCFTHMIWFWFCCCFR